MSVDQGVGSISRGQLRSGDLITGAQRALNVDGSVWFGNGRWLVVAVGLFGACYGLFTFVRWIVGLVETWKNS
ncbi:MAG: hypothetical protein L0J58_09275 [Micrococcaceae bacterium]|nr:hypothetical protein [Micrococcaceae bacterium]